MKYKLKWNGDEWVRIIKGDDLPCGCSTEWQEGARWGYKMCRHDKTWLGTFDGLRLVYAEIDPAIDTIDAKNQALANAR